jgi:hypothetical protein
MGATGEWNSSLRVKSSRYREGRRNVPKTAMKPPDKTQNQGSKENQNLKGKPARRWLKTVLAILDKWAAEEMDLTFIYGASGCSIRQSGKIANLEDGTFLFSSQFGMSVGLFPELWDSVRSDDWEIKIHVEAGEANFTITPMPRVNPAKIVQIDEQLRLWMKVALEVSAVVSYGAYATSGRYQLKELSSPQMFALVDKTGANAHIILLDRCRYLELKRDPGSCAITVQGGPGEPTVQVSDENQTPENMLAQYSPDSRRVH